MSSKTSNDQTDRFGRVFRLNGDLRQRHVEEWNRVYIELKPLGMAEQRGAQLRAAIVAGWIESPGTNVTRRVELNGRESVEYSFDGVEVGDMPAGEVAYYGAQCEQAFAAATRVPAEKK